MKILITGIAGFIGFSIAKDLIKDKNNLVYGIDNFDSYYSKKYKKFRIEFFKKKKNFKLFKLDITNKKLLLNFFSKNNFDVVMHFAAQAGVRYSLINPKKYIKVNKNGFKYLLDAMIKNNPPKKIIYASSSSVYGNSKKLPTKETHKLIPNNIYAKTKISNEQLAIKYKKKYKLNICGLRFFTVYGEWGRPDMFLFKLLKAYKSNNTFYLNNFGNHLRDFTYIGDIIKILNKLIKLNKFTFDKVNICGSKPVNIKKIFTKFIKEHNFRNFTLIKKNKADVLNTHGDNKLLKKIINFSKFTSFSSGFKKTKKWYFKNHIHKF